VLTIEVTHRATGCSVVFVDDERVGTAYLRDPEGTIIGDTWLYNCGPAPREVDWTDASQAPFPNEAEFALELDQPPPSSAEDVTVEWFHGEELLLANVYLRGVLIGRLSPGSQPGWSAFARADGPLARKLDDA
jgi:hypothetical protein